MSVAVTERLSGLLPDADRVRQALAKTEEEATLLRRLLALCLRGEQTPEQRARLRQVLQESGTCGVT